MTTPPTDDPTAPAGRVGLFRWPVIALVLLTVTAGYSDGYALGRFDVFIANQSGNIVRAGMGIFGEYDAWPLALLSMTGFAIGAVLSWLLGVPGARRGWVLIRVRLLATSLVLGLWWVAVIVVGNNDQKGILCSLVGGMALGILASIVPEIAGTPMQPAFQTATVLNAARGLVQWVVGKGELEAGGRRLALLGALTILCYGLGGALGAFAIRLGSTAVLIGLLLPVVALLLTRREGSGSPRS
ncbi:MAG TPA: hypothetical protein DCQ36_00550 [Actinobacteria bacterium]|jgi:uncharacterized membrane protein YoaK (UPF0700 family)|nr:hypothetical protein [Actinomycetota bacterium]